MEGRLHRLRCVRWGCCVRSHFLRAAGSSPKFVGVGATATAASNSIGVPAGVVAGDLLLIICTSGGTHTLTTTTGWTQILSNPGTASLRHQVWWKTAGSSESANSVVSTQSRMRIVMLAYRGAAASPVDVAPATSATGSSTSAAPASVTTTATGDLVIGFCSTSTNATYTAPASVTERYNVACDGSINGLCYWDEIQIVKGASTVRTAAVSPSSSWAAYSAAFKRE